VIALLRAGAGRLLQGLEAEGSALPLLERELGLFAREALAPILRELNRWASEGIRALTPLHPDYPPNLRAVHDRPPLLFLAGDPATARERAVAVIGTRAAPPEALERARLLAERLAEAGFAVISGLAAGIDTAAHEAALRAGGATVAVLGTGLHRCYPPQNARLQARIASCGAVISRFWPEEGPTPERFRRRNALMSGLSLASVIVAAGPRSGCRIQARAALAHGRRVLVDERLLSQPWARELVERPGVHVYAKAEEVIATVERLSFEEALTG